MTEPLSSETKLTKNACVELAEAVERAEQLAHRLGFHESAQALNKAKNKVGWETAYLLNKADAEYKRLRTEAERKGWHIPNVAVFGPHTCVNYWRGCQHYERNPSLGRPVRPAR